MINRKILVKGLPGCPGIGVGKAHIIINVEDLHKFMEGEILVTEIVDPDWFPAIKKAAGIVMNSQSLVSRNLIRVCKIPCVDGTRGLGENPATEVIRDGTIITVDGEAGIVYGDIEKIGMTFEDFRKRLIECRYCKELGLNIEPNPLIWGESCAKIVEISQAPSRSSSKCGRPFSKSLLEPNASGKKIIEWYDVSKEVFYNPSIFYVTGIAHCYTGRGKGGDRKAPKICAKKWLEEELSYLNPKLYIIIGKQAAGFLFPYKKYDDLIFNNNMVYRGVQSVVIPHPSSSNNNWFKNHPEFKKDRLPYIRKLILKAIIDCR